MTPASRLALLKLSLLRHEHAKRKLQIAFVFASALLSFGAFAASLFAASSSAPFPFAASSLAA
jgi:hypothetical protein